MSSCPLSRRQASFKSCPREGASFARGAGRDPYTRFKSCPREGASAGNVKILGSMTVSSHAPVRGHPSPKTPCCCPCCFKSCPREGASLVVQFSASWVEFQVMPP